MKEKNKEHLTSAHLTTHNQKQKSLTNNYTRQLFAWFLSFYYLNVTLFFHYKTLSKPQLQVRG